MAEQALETLRAARAALEQGFINQTDYDLVKDGFLRAQQMKAGLDAGFILPEDYAQVKAAFLHSLGMLSVSGGSAAHPGSLVSHPLPAAVAVANGSAPAAAGGQAASSSSGLLGQPVQLAQRTAPVQAAGAAAPSGARRPNIPTNIPKMSGNRPRQNNQLSLSGISVAEDSVNLYYYIKAKSAYRWAVWRVNEAGNQVVIADVGEKDSTFRDFLSSLPDADCRYGVFDFQYSTTEGTVQNKLVFFNWAPDTAKTKSKMMYASTKDFFKGHLDGLAIEMQANELDDITEAEVSNSIKTVMTRG